MKRTLFSLIAFLSIQASLLAGNITREEKFASISGISVSDKFNVTMVDGPSIKVSLTIEEVMADLVHMSLIDGILSITYDEKSMTKEIKSVLKQRDPKSIRMDIEISIPATCSIKSITLTDDAVFSSKANLSQVDVFTLNASDKSVIKSLNIKSKESSIFTSKHADVKLASDCDKLTLSSAGNSVVEISSKGGEAVVETQGASTIKFSSSVNALVVNASGSSKLTFDGSTKKIEVNSKNSSYIDASKLIVQSSRLNMASSYCDINAKDTIYLNLSNGAKLQFAGAPVLEVVKVEKSSIYKKEAAK